MYATLMLLFFCLQIGDEYWAYITECRDPKACTVLLQGPTKDLINEVERNLQDAMNSARNVLLEPRLCHGGGATEMALSQVSYVHVVIPLNIMIGI